MELEVKTSQAVITGLLKDHQNIQRPFKTGGSSLNMGMSAGATGELLFSKETVGVEEQKELL